ncbi:MAG: hypothetical protein NC081_06940 [Roseburia sp.]|nr:hypothetical protein [Roseburia sp.]
MAKKFGKVLLFTAAIGTAAAAAYYYLQKKEADSEAGNDEDYDDFSDPSDEDTGSNSRTYVELQRDASASDADSTVEETHADDFTPLKKVAQAAENTMEKAVDSVEEFFDENDEDISASEDSENLEESEELPLSED